MVNCKLVVSSLINSAYSKYIIGTQRFLHSPFDDWRRFASDLDLEKGLRSFVGLLILQILHDLGDLELVGG